MFFVYLESLRCRSWWAANCSLSKWIHFMLYLLLLLVIFWFFLFFLLFCLCRFAYRTCYWLWWWSYSCGKWVYPSPLFCCSNIMLFLIICFPKFLRTYVDSLCFHQMRTENRISLHFFLIKWWCYQFNSIFLYCLISHSC